MRRITLLLIVILSCAWINAQSDYNIRQAESHQRDAASYVRQAQGYDRDVEYYTREAAGHLRDAEYYHRMKQYDRARNALQKA